MDRPRLTGQLTACVNRLVTVVSAPAAAGKTYAVAAWARQWRSRGRVAWLTVDEGDDAPGVFWAYAIESLRFHGVRLDEDVRVPSRADAVDRSLLAGLAAAVAEQDEPVVLVLDQIEAAASGEVSAGLDFVLRHAGSNLRLVMTTRADPVLPVHRYRLSGELSEVGQGALAFTHEEAVALLDRRRPCVAVPARTPRLSDDAVAILLRRTEGWAGGLRLYALALQQVDDPERFVRQPRLNEDAIADYLRAEVLDALPPATRDLLQRVSVLDRIHPDLADALTGRDDAAVILRELAKANAFIERIENTGQWYRCHPMFAEALRDQLNEQQPGAEAALHRVAARWLADAGQLTGCLGHATVVEDWELAATQVVEQLAVGRLLGGRDAHQLTAYLAKMPRDQHGSAAVAIVAAALATGGPDLSRCVAQLDLADELTAELAPQRQPAYRLGIAAVRVVASRLLGDVATALAAAEIVETTIPRVPTCRPADLCHLSALVLVHLGAAQLWAGDLDPAERTLQRAIDASDAPALDDERHGAHGQLALLHLVRGRLSQAQRHGLEAAAVADRSGTPVVFHSGAGRVALAVIALERNDSKHARTQLRDAVATVDARQDPLVVVELALVRSRIERAGGRHRAALDALRQAAEWSRQRCDPGWVADRLLAEQVRVHLATHDPAAALTCVNLMTPGPERVLATARIHLAALRPAAALAALAGLTGPGAGQCQRTDVAINAHLLRAQVALATKDEPAARSAITAAYELARPDGVRRPFLDVGVWLRQALARSPDLTQVRRWLVGDRPVAGAPMPVAGAAPPAAVVETLSRREREVLGLLAQGFTAQEISMELYVSVNTVKTHLKGIYRKLSASRRGEAVRYARQLNLI